MSSWNVNRVIIIGRLTHEPELRALPSGHTVCDLRLASSTHRKSADGERQEKPNYFDVSVFGAAGETVHRYMSKGSRVAVDGRLEWREWESAEGAKRQAVKIVADTVQFLENAPASGSNGSAKGKGNGEDQPELAGVGSGIEDDVVF